MYTTTTTLLKCHFRSSGAGAVLPRGPLPAALTKPLASVLQRAHFTSNPCKARPHVGCVCAVGRPSS